MRCGSRWRRLLLDWGATICLQLEAQQQQQLRPKNTIECGWQKPSDGFSSPRHRGHSHSETHYHCQFHSHSWTASSIKRSKWPAGLQRIPISKGGPNMHSHFFVSRRSWFHLVFPALAPLSQSTFQSHFQPGSSLSPAVAPATPPSSAESPNCCSTFPHPFLATPGETWYVVRLVTEKPQKYPTNRTNCLLQLTINPFSQCNRLVSPAFMWLFIYMPTFVSLGSWQQGLRTKDWGLSTAHRRLRNGQWVIEARVGDCRVQQGCRNALQLATFQPGSDDRDNSAEEPACCPIERPQSGAHQSWETGLLDLGQAEV